MYPGELRDKGKDYYNGHMTGVSRFSTEVREGICKYMYNKKKKRLTMFEVCSLIRNIEHDYIKFCETYGLSSDFDEDDGFTEDDE